jgi:hypothetical protein
VARTRVRCWAESLGGCRDGRSGEHPISRNQFFKGGGVLVRGLPWCPEWKAIGLNSFESNVLCKRHNEQLSPVDDEALKLRVALQRFYSTIEGEQSSEINARLFERWLLKTAINFALQYPDDPPAIITDEMVRIAYGLASPPRGQGFFFVATKGDPAFIDDGAFRFQLQKDQRTGELRLFGVEFHGSSRMIYAFEGAPTVPGALRLPALYNVNDPTQRIGFGWSPEPAVDDRTMTSEAAEAAELRAAQSP